MPVPFSSNNDRAVIVGTILQRPGDVLDYKKDDLVAQSTNVASISPIVFSQAGPFGAGSLCEVHRAKLWKSSTNITHAQFHVHLFGTMPTSFAAGDGDAMSLCGTNYYGAIDVLMDQAFLDGAYGFGVPSSGSVITAKVDSGIRIYALLETQGNYAPTSGERFELTLEVS